MALPLGDRDRFAVEVGDEADQPLRRVDLWAAGHWLTRDDNMAFVEQFRRAVADTAGWVRSGQAEPLPFPGVSPAAAHRRLLDGIRDLDDDYPQFRPFDRWGPTTDNVLGFLFRDGDSLVLTFEFWREEHLRKHPEHAGTVLVAVLSVDEFAGILDQLVAVLGQGRNAEPPGAEWPRSGVGEVGGDGAGFAVQ
ncbi:hypothetical protein GCM10022254_15440 [Actinomadura meridiana]|uniref:Uncharacterized protein n=1 Tax=Actinomadura meridiana TaxID=559626 RepID=A0ABP8BVH2_9ACTN